MDLFFEILIISSGLMVFLSMNPVHSVLFLISLFLNGCGLILLLGFEFLSLVLLVVYVGAITVLFLFIVMMMNLKPIDLRQSLLDYYPFGIVMILIFFLQLKRYISDPFLWVNISNLYTDWSYFYFFESDLVQLGQGIYTYFYISFILSSYLLLVAMIGAIFLTYIRKKKLKKQKIYIQVNREKKDSLIYWKRKI
jgi:NADH-quinone oxidoreductase subunit J